MGNAMRVGRVGTRYGMLRAIGRPSRTKVTGMAGSTGASMIADEYMQRNQQIMSSTEIHKMPPQIEQSVSNVSNVCNV